MIENFDLNEKINLIYNFVYNENNINCHKLDNIDIKKIKMEDIKIGLNNEEVNSIVRSEVLNGQFKMLGYNPTNNMLILKRYSDTFPVSLFISPYKYNDNINSMTSLNNNDALISYILSQLVLNNSTKHILLPVINFDSKFPQIFNLIKSYKPFKNYSELLDKKKINDVFSVRVKEHFFKSYNLLNYLIESNKSDSNKESFTYKNLLFQLIHTLSVIQKEHKKFRHNNLSPENIYIYKKQKDSSSKYVSAKGKTFVLNNNEFDIKIGNFDKTKLDESKINRYYDLHYFLNKLYGINSFKNMDSETKTFLDKILPTKYRGKGKNNFYQMDNKELFIPENLLNDEYFKSLQVTETKSSKNKVSKDEHSTQQFLTNLESESKYVLGNQSEIEPIHLTRTLDVNSKKEKKITRSLVKKNKSYNDSYYNDSHSLREINHFDKVKNNKRQLKNQKGGFNKMTTDPYKKEKNSPFVSNESREIYKRRLAEAPPKREPPVIAEQKVYDTQAGKRQLPQVYPPEFVPTPNPYYPYPNYEHAYGYKPNRIPVQKYYNISLSNPMGDHTYINKVYEDMLPTDPYAFTLKSVYERRQLINYF